MANVIDSLVISIGLDPAELKQGMQQVEAHLNAALGIVAQFATGVDQGFREGADGAEDLASAAQDAGEALQEVGDKGAKGLNKVSGKARKATTQVRTLQTEAKKLGSSLGGKLKGFLTGIAAPVAGMLAAGTVVKGYFSDLSTLDTLSRKTSLSMEERASKQKLLAKYSKEDLERYRESNKALGSLGDTLSRAFSPIMSAIVPALSWLARGLENVIKFVQRHKSFIIPLITGIAAVITGALLPALKAAGAAAMKAMLPFLPWIALVGGLALLIDDLWSYMNGGKSALADFWAIFGTGEEISQSLAETWEVLKDIGTAVWKGLTIAASVFFSYFGGAIQPLINIFKNALKIIKGIFTGDFELISSSIMGIFDSMNDYIIALWSGLGNIIYDALIKVFDMLGIDIKGIFNSVIEWIKTKIDWLVSLLPDVDGMIDSVKGAGQAVSDFGSGVADSVGGFFSSINPFGGDSSASVSPAMAGGSVDNSSETTVHVGGVTVNAQSTDPAGIARETGNELRRMTATGNKGVRQ